MPTFDLFSFTDADLPQGAFLYRHTDFLLHSAAETL